MKVCLNCQKAFCSNDWICPSCRYEPVRIKEILAHAPSNISSERGFKSEYFAQLVSIEGGSFWFQARNRLIIQSLHRYKAAAKNFLEIGCGTGFVLAGIANSFPGISISGSEIFLEGLVYASARLPSGNFMQMDARHIPFVNEFDVVGVFDVLEHIKEDEIVLEQIHRSLRPDGILLITVPQHPWLWSAADDYACHVRRYSSQELVSKVKKAGFTLVRRSSFVSLLLPFMIASRLFGLKKKEEAYNPLTEFQINTILNSFFGHVMTIEIFLLFCGINLPFGGSLLLIAKKHENSI